MTYTKKAQIESNSSSPSELARLSAAVRGLFFFLFFSISVFSQPKIKLVILHTNDTHSQVEPTEKSNLSTSDMGGYARRMGVIANIRSEEKNVLLFDAGDYSQGTPYFNFYNGRIEVDALNRMKYDAITIGNHEFDNGVDTLAAVLSGAKFPVLSSNYNLAKTALKGIVKPYLVINRYGLRIGVIATNIDPKGLIIESNYKGITCNDPYKTANQLSEYLKKKKHCDVIICLSHLGLQPDKELAMQSKNIDLIISAHSHSLTDNLKVQNAVGKEVVIAQMGKSGLYLGRVDLELQKKE